MLDRFAALLHQRWYRIWLGPAILLGFQLGCQGDPYFTRYTRKEPSRSGMVGWYQPTKESRDYIIRRGYDSASMVVILSEDGTFTLDGMPDIWRDGLGRSNGRFESAKGSWKLDQARDGRWMIHLDVSRISSTSGVQSNERFGMPVALVGDRAPCLLHFTIGDPDQGEAIQCARSNLDGVLYSQKP